MRIKSLHITGFKSLRDVTWEPGGLNVIIGPNGSGKSNLLTALELLSASAQGRLGKFIQRLGGAKSISWDGAADKIIAHLSLNSDTVHELQQNDDSFYYIIELLIRDMMNDCKIVRELFCVQTGDSDVIYLDRETRNTLLGSDTAFIKVGSKNIGIDIESLSESVISSITTGVAGDIRIISYKVFITNLGIYHTINTTEESKLRLPPVARYEKRVDPDGQNLITVLHTLYSEDRQFKKDIHTAMQAAFGDDFEELVFPPAADQRVQLRIRWKSLKREQSLGDISDGTLRFLFLMTVLAAPNPAPLIAIDEPETGLHPSMFPIIAEYAAQAAKKTQVVFTTHSPQFLDACGPFLPTVTVTSWKNGETTLKNLDGDLLTKWLADYSLGNMFESGDLEALA